MRNILFRADSSFSIGTGHVMRDLVLASQLTKEFPHAKIIFAIQNLEGNINYKIVENGYELIILKSHIKKELLDVLKSRHVEMLIVDHYGIDYEYEGYIKENSNVKILSFDDTYEKHNCNILLNHNISANKKRYENLVPKNCELRCGSKYTLLRDEFIKEKNRLTKRTKTKEKTIFLAMGGADTAQLNIKILKVLQKLHNIKVHVATTSANQHLDKLQNYVQNKKWINLHVNYNKIAKLMAKSNLVIVTPSVTVNEVIFMERPFIAIKTANNQEDMYKYLKNKKYLVLAKFNKTKLKSNIIKILDNLI